MKKTREYFREMTPTFRVFLVASIVSGLLFATVLIAGCTYPTYCCPTGAAVASNYDWVCPANCPGGGTVVIDWEVGYTDSNNNEPCDPGDIVIAIKNITDNVDIPARVLNPSVGTYKGSETLKITKDTEFGLNITGGSCSYSGKETLPVHVVSQGSYLTLVRNGKLTFPDMMFTNIPVNAGPGVKVEKVQNLNQFDIVVKKDTIIEVIPAVQNGTAFQNRGIDANGLWSIGLTNEHDLSIYNNQLANPNLSVNIYMGCSCH